MSARTARANIPVVFAACLLLNLSPAQGAQEDPRVMMDPEHFVMLHPDDAGARPKDVPVEVNHFAISDVLGGKAADMKMSESGMVFMPKFFFHRQPPLYANYPDSTRRHSYHFQQNFGFNPYFTPYPYYNPFFPVF